MSNDTQYYQPPTERAAITYDRSDWDRHLNTATGIATMLVMAFVFASPTVVVVFGLGVWLWLAVWATLPPVSREQYPRTRPKPPSPLGRIPRSF